MEMYSQQRKSNLLLKAPNLRKKERVTVTFVTCQAQKSPPHRRRAAFPYALAGGPERIAFISGVRLAIWVQLSHCHTFSHLTTKRCEKRVTL